MNVFDLHRKLISDYAEYTRSFIHISDQRIYAERISFELSSDSFLTQSAANLPSTMLGWHYRSRSESLISFSNAAFYARQLLTVPDVNLPKAVNEITASAPEAGDSNVEYVLDRPVSFHFLSNGVYEDRRNAAEAGYIKQQSDAVSRSIAESLRKRGYVVELSVGDSHFRCDLAVRRSGDTRHRLGILVDALYKSRTEVMERWLLQPGILQGFDWQVLHVTAKDWHHDPATTLANIERVFSPAFPESANFSNGEYQEPRT